MKPRLFIVFAAVCAAACSQQHDPAPSSDAVAAADGADAGRIRAAQIRAQIAAARTAPGPPLVAASDHRELDWLELMPPADLAALENGPPLSHTGQRRMAQQGSFATVSSVTGQNVKLPGYVVPLSTDDQGALTEFFFVPYFGACLHVPPPPPNQIVHVVLGSSVPSPEMWNPQWLRGRLRAATTENALGGSAYVMEDASLVPYDG